MHENTKRRGILYSLTSILLVTSIVFLALLSTRTPPIPDAPREVTRATSLMKTFERDAQRGFTIISTRALLSLVQYVANTTQPVHDTHEAFHEALVNGTYNGTLLSLMQGTSMTDWLAKLNTTLAQQHARLNLTLTNITLHHTSPWEVESKANLTYTLSLARASYTRSIILTSRMSIINLEDPLYTIASQGRIPNIIIPANTTDIHQLINASYNNSLYIPSSLAPSYLQRLAFNTTPSAYGIESIANGEIFILNGYTQYDGRSSIDYEYFTNQTPVVCVNNTPAWFRINPAHTSLYTNLTIIPCS